MRILLLLNGSRERYGDGADQARMDVWCEYGASTTVLEVGYLPGEAESGGVSRSFAFGTGEAVRTNAQLHPERCVEAEREGYDAVIIHCFAEPGLAEARQKVRIPVIGPGEATLRAGALLSRSIGVTVPSDGSVDHHWRQMDEVGVRDRVIGIEPINRPIGAYSSQDPKAMTDAVVLAAEKLVARGAEVICPSGLAFIPVRVNAAEVSARVGVPVLDPALLAMRLAETMVEAVSPR